MANLLKNIYSDDFYNQYCKVLIKYLPNFSKIDFLYHIYGSEWEALSLKERMAKNTKVLDQYLPNYFPDACNLLIKMLPDFKASNTSQQSLVYMFLPDYIKTYGLAFFEESMAAMEQITPFTSCEFAIRYFIQQYPEKTMAQMLLWSQHPNHHVRRLASEGSRPRLPWAMALPAFKREPTPILPILQQLKNDSSKYVRKSVANNLNDIAKDNPDFVLEVAEEWYGNNKNTDWVVKHGLRTLLKQANRQALAIVGLIANPNVSIQQFSLQTNNIQLGEYLHFSLAVHNNSAKRALLRLEYAVYYQKANASLSKKVYKISEKEYAANTVTSIKRKQHFKPISTRRYHAGLHQIEIIVNGVVCSPKLSFELVI